MLIVKTSYNEAKRFEHSGVRAKVGNKKHQVYFKVYCDDTDVKDCIELYRSSGNILMLEYQGALESIAELDLNGIYIAKVFDFGTNITEDDVLGVSASLRDGLVGVLRVPTEYKDMEFIYNMSQKYSNIRFCGGTTFCLDGCRLGCCGRDIFEKRNVKYDDKQYFHEGCCCAAETVSDTEVELEECKVTKRVGTKSSSNNGGGGKKKVALFKDLLYSGGTFEL